MKVKVKENGTINLTLDGSEHQFDIYYFAIVDASWSDNLIGMLSKLREISKVLGSEKVLIPIGLYDQDVDLLYLKKDLTGRIEVGLMQTAELNGYSIDVTDLPVYRADEFNDLEHIGRTESISISDFQNDIQESIDQLERNA